MPTAVLVAAILIMAGNGVAAGAQSAPSKQSAPAAFDPCTLLTKQEAATAVGEAVGEPKPSRPGRSIMPGVSVAACDYESASRSHVQVSVWRAASDSAGLFRQTYGGVCASKERLSGLGDVACWYNAEHRELQVLKGTTFLIFEIGRSGNATEALTTVAKKALARLP